MKKIYATLVLISTLLCAACGNAGIADPQKAHVLRFETEALIDAYCKDLWDGSFISDSEHCASIRDGELWLDCSLKGSIPDLGTEEDCYWLTVIDSSQDGTWIQDTKFGSISKWKKGVKLQNITLASDKIAHYTSVWKLKNCLVARYGQYMWIYSLEGRNIHMLDNVLDCYYDDLNSELFVSDFERQNYSVLEDGNLQVLSSNYVFFQRNMESVKNVSSEYDQVLAFAIDKFYSEEWNGEVTKFEKYFVAVDFNGNIIVNNEKVGNVSLGTSYYAQEGPNTYLDKKTSFVHNGKELIKFNRGEQTKWDTPDGKTHILWVSDNEVILKSTPSDYVDGKGSIYIVNIDTNEVNIISENALDAYVAYDTIYYMDDSSTVYSLDRENADAKPSIYVEGAYAVAHHSDESQGAIVPKEIANYESGYGYSNIYSPYGT